MSQKLPDQEEKVQFTFQTQLKPVGTSRRSNVKVAPINASTKSESIMSMAETEENKSEVLPFKQIEVEVENETEIR